jgi:hypothetical protein
MSINSMTEVAFLSRTDVPPQGFAPAKIEEIAGAAKGKSAPENAVNTALHMVTTYVPTEVLTLYVAVMAALRDPHSKSLFAQWLTFWIFLIGTPVVVWLVYAAKVKNSQRPVPAAPSKWPLWEMVAATVAYVAWAFALPDTPFMEFQNWYSAALGGVIVLIVSTLLALIAPLVQRPLSP